MINEKDFLEAGFLKTEDNLFLYSKELVSKKKQKNMILKRMKYLH